MKVSSQTLFASNKHLSISLIGLFFLIDLFYLTILGTLFCGPALLKTKTLIYDYLPFDIWLPSICWRTVWAEFWSFPKKTKEGGHFLHWESSNCFFWNLARPNWKTLCEKCFKLKNYQLRGTSNFEKMDQNWS